MAVTLSRKQRHQLLLVLRRGYGKRELGSKRSYARRHLFDETLGGKEYMFHATKGWKVRRATA